jgi:hypothetical protein
MAPAQVKQRQPYCRWLQVLAVYRIEWYHVAIFGSFERCDTNMRCSWCSSYDFKLDQTVTVQQDSTHAKTAEIRQQPACCQAAFSM